MGIEETPHVTTYQVCCDADWPAGAKHICRGQASYFAYYVGGRSIAPRSGAMPGNSSRVLLLWLEPNGNVLHDVIPVAVEGPWFEFVTALVSVKL